MQRLGEAVYEQLAQINLELALKARDGLDCYLCGRKLGATYAAWLGFGPRLRCQVHVDHVFPRCKGGSKDFSNLRLAHAYCNMRKGGKLLSELDWYVER